MRTEEEVFKDFEKLGWRIIENTNKCLTAIMYGNSKLDIVKRGKVYYVNNCLNMQEHKLLNELFTIWNWL